MSSVRPNKLRWIAWCVFLSLIFQLFLIPPVAAETTNPTPVPPSGAMFFHQKITSTIPAPQVIDISKDITGGLIMNWYIGLSDYNNAGFAGNQTSYPEMFVVKITGSNKLIPCLYSTYTLFTVNTSTTMMCNNDPSTTISVTKTATQVQYELDAPNFPVADAVQYGVQAVQRGYEMIGGPSIYVYSDQLNDFNKYYTNNTLDDNKYYFSTPLFSTFNYDLALSDAFSDANIDAYVKNKVDYTNTHGTDDDKTWITNFTNYMNKFKNNSDGTMRDVYKRILAQASTNVDPLNILPNVLNANDFAAVKQNYFDQVDVGSANDSSYNTAVAKEYALLRSLEDVNVTDSCADLNQNLQYWADVATAWGIIAGVVAGTASAFFIPVFGAAAIGVGVGLGTNALIVSHVDQGTQQKMIDVTKKFASLIYAISYLSIKEAANGLSLYYTSRGSSAYYTGLNPHKMAALGKDLNTISTSWQACAAQIKAGTASLTGSGTDNNGCPNGGGLLNIGGAIDSAMCNMAYMVYSFINNLVVDSYNLFNKIAGNSP